MTLEGLQSALKLGFKELKIPPEEKKNVHVQLRDNHIILSYYITKVFIDIRELN